MQKGWAQMLLIRIWDDLAHTEIHKMNISIVLVNN
jgi:hypothetical protein